MWGYWDVLGHKALLGHGVSLLGKAFFKVTDSLSVLGTSSVLVISSVLGTSLLAHGCPARSGGPFPARSGGWLPARSGGRLPARESCSNKTAKQHYI